MDEDLNQPVNEAISLFRGIVAGDGGDLALESYDAQSGVVRVNYAQGKNDECAGCLITPHDMGLFLREAIQSRGIDVSDVEVISA